jgi:hypothetical protein
MATNGSWLWVARYVAVLLLALILGAAIGELGLFKQTTLGSPKVTAARLAQFLGYGGALLLLWLLAQRAARELRARGGHAQGLGSLLVPLATLVVVPSCYYVLLIFAGGLMSTAFRAVFNWVFVLGTTAAAIWLTVALFHHAEALVGLFRRRRGAG